MPQEDAQSASWWGFLFSPPHTAHSPTATGTSCGSTSPAFLRERVPSARCTVGVGACYVNKVKEQGVGPSVCLPVCWIVLNKLIRAINKLIRAIILVVFHHWNRAKDLKHTIGLLCNCCQSQRRQHPLPCLPTVIPQLYNSTETKLLTTNHLFSPPHDE